MTGQPLDTLPLWGLYPLTVVFLLAGIVGGYRYVEGRKRKSAAVSDAGVGAIAAATLALIAFLMAFVVGAAMNLVQERRTLVVSEANAIGTTYLRAGYLDEPHRTESRDLLREYVDWRVAALDPDELVTAKARSEEIHQELWKVAEDIVGAGSTAATTGLYVSSLNEVIDVHTERVAVGLHVRVPPMIILSLYLMALFTMILVGMQSAYAESRHFVSLFLLVLVLCSVLYLIVDLDRAQEGLLKVPQQAMIDLQAQIGTLP